MSALEVEVALWGLSFDHCVDLRTECVQCEGFGEQIHARIDEATSDDCVL